MRRRGWALAAGAIVLTTISGCGNSGGRAGSAKFAGAANAGSGTLRLTAMSLDLVEGATPGVHSMIYLWVDGVDLPAIKDPMLWVDEGNGWREYSLWPFPTWQQQPKGPHGAYALGPGTRYQLRGTDRGQPAWSNVVVERPIDWARDWGQVAIAEPAGVTYGAAPQVTGVTGASWSAGPAGTTSYLLTLWRRDVFQGSSGPADLLEPVHALETTSTSARFDDVHQRLYKAPPAVPLPAAEYALAVVAVDATGWAFASSNVGPPPPWAPLQGRESYHHFDAR